jgi:hypothetical protein
MEEPLADINILAWGTEKYYNFRNEDQKVFSREHAQWGKWPFLRQIKNGQFGL